MAYRLTVERKVEKYLRKLPPRRYLQISNTIHKLEDFPSISADIKPLKGKYQGSFRLRVSGWRVLFTVLDKEKTIKIWQIDRRGDIY